MTETSNSDAAATTAPEARTRRQRRMAREPQRLALDVATTTSSGSTRMTKASTVEKLLRLGGGASLDELCLATGWQSHTCRAFLTGLRKKGLVVEKTRGNDGVTRWSVAATGDA